MKKNVLRKEFLMEIRKTLGRFISIFFIVMLGVAFYSGIRSSEPSMRISGDKYFDDSELMDIKVMGTMGLSEEDIRAIDHVDGIERVEGGYSKDVLCPAGETEKVVHLMSIQDSFNKINVVEGRLPVKAGECLIDEDFLQHKKYKIGDKITFKSGDDQPLSDSLKTDTYTVVGIGNSPLYISFSRGSSMIGNGEVSGFIAVDQSSFDMDVYTEAYVRVKDSFDTTVFTEDYDNLTAQAKEALEKIKDERCEARREEIVGGPGEELADAKDQIADEEQRLENAKDELETAKTTAQKELDAARDKMQRGETRLDESRKQIEQGEAQIADAKQQLDDQQKAIDEGRREYEKGLSKLQQSEIELKKGEQQYQAIYGPTIKLFDGMQEQMDKSRARLEANDAQYQKDLQENEEKLKPYRELLNRADVLEQQISHNQQQLESDKAQYDSVIRKQSAGETLTREEQEFINSYQELRDRQISAQRELQDVKSSPEYMDASLLLESQKTIRQNIEDNNRQTKDLNDREEQLHNARKELLSKGEEIEQGKAQIAQGYKKLDAARISLDEGQRQLDAVRETLRTKEFELIMGKSELSKGELELTEGRGEYQKASMEALMQLRDGEMQIADGEQMLIEAKQDMVDAEDKLAKVENPKWYIQDRAEALPDYSGYGENADRMRAIGKVFPVLFFLVAALISLTSMTRMVEEQRVQIGTLKALGYDKLSIAKKYIYYALLATLGGSLFGVLLGEKIFPFIIIFAYKIMYQHIPDIVIPYHLSYAVQATVIAVFCTLLATVFSCYKELEAQPAQLMRPPAPKQGKRIFLERVGWLWRRLNFTWKSSIRNLIRYKKRFFMTIFGIGGCMALMVVGFGLKDCIYEITDLQYGKIQYYEANAFMNDEMPGEERKDILNFMDENRLVDEYMQTRMFKTDIKAGDKTQSVYVTVPEDKVKVKDFMSFRNRMTKEEYLLEKDEVILTEKAAKVLGVKAGDEVTIEDEDHGDKTVKIKKICENYLGHYLYLTADVYEDLYGARPRYNSIIYSAGENGSGNVEKVGTELLKFDDVLNVSYTSSLEGRLSDMLKSLNLVIVVLIISAGMLAFVVLYNLNNININERKRELATLKVLGFHDMEVAQYVYRENIMLTLIGSLVGMGLGNILHRFVILTVEVNEAMFGRQIHWQSYLYSFLFSLGFSLFVNFVMYYKLKKIDMVESLKSVE